MATIQPDRRRRRARNQSVAGLKEAAGVVLLELPPGERTQFIAYLAQLSAIAAVATHRAFRRLTGMVTPDRKELPVDEALSALREIK